MQPTKSLPTSFEVDWLTIPAVGLGTFQGDEGNGLVRDIVLKALQKGYRHIDTAAAYGNEKEVGEAIKLSGISREDIFVTTKLPQTWHKPSDVEEGLDRSLKELQLDYVDLFLMHFPHAYAAGPNNSTLRHPDGKPVIDYELSRAYPQTWAAMEFLVDKGKAKHIGLSNFNILKTKRILEMSRIRPAVNQVEMHPYLPQNELLSFLSRHCIHAMAHQPLGGRPVAAVNLNADQPGPLSDLDIAKIASECGVSPAQVLLSWAVQRGTSVVPKTAQESRLSQNRELVRLTKKHMEIVNNISQVRGSVRFLDPRNHIGFNIFSEDVDEPRLELK